VTRLRVLISTSSFGLADRAPLERLEEAGLEYQLNPHGRVMTEDEVADLLVDMDGVIAGTESLSERVLARAGRLRVISRVGVGVERIDLDAAERRGVQVFTTPDALTDAVAELTLGGMLSLLRGIHEMNAGMHAGSWEKHMGRLLRGKTVAIVGLGRIGRRVAQLLEPFGVRRLACDAEPDYVWAAAHGVVLTTLDDLLSEADILTVHASGSECLVGATELARLRPEALVVNVARGGLVDEDALYDALVSGHLAGCYVDVFAREPYQGPLAELPNALLTPHVGSYAREARARMESEAVENLLGALRGSMS